MVGVEINVVHLGSEITVMLHVLVDDAHERGFLLLGDEILLLNAVKYFFVHNYIIYDYP